MDRTNIFLKLLTVYKFGTYESYNKKIEDNSRDRERVTKWVRELRERERKKKRDNIERRWI